MDNLKNCRKMKLTLETKNVKIWALFLAAALMITSMDSCRRKHKHADAYGVFEATEIIVSSENNGKLLSFDVKEAT